MPGCLFNFLDHLKGGLLEGGVNKREACIKNIFFRWIDNLTVHMFICFISQLFVSSLFPF